MSINKFIHLIDNYCQKDYIAIVANGEAPSSSYIISYLKNAKYIICCDGAISFLESISIFPDYIIGDCDSISENQIQRYQSILIQRKNQDYNDLTKSLVFANTTYPDIKTVVIFGAFGLREDHTIGNFSVILEQNYPENMFITLSDYGMFVLHNSMDTKKYPTVLNMQVSFMSKQTAISCKELKWQLDHYKISMMHQATLNQATDTYIEVTSSDPTLIYFAFCTK